LDAAAAQAIANHWLRSKLGNMPHAGDPVRAGEVWRVPIHLDFPVPGSTDTLPFRDLGEIVIDAGCGEVASFPTIKEREARMAEEIGRVLGEIHNEIQEFECERCGKCCGPLGATAMELNIIDEHVRRHNIEVPEYSQIEFLANTIVRTTENTRCPYLKDNECVVYKVRPTICRLFGTVAAHMNCAASNGGVKEPITSKAAFSILRRVQTLSSLWVAMCKHGLEVDA